jgi:hypothetical protein
METTPSGVPIVGEIRLAPAPVTWRAHPKTWGPWKLNAKTRVLWVSGRWGASGYGYYEVDLDRCLTSGAVLDWIAQVSQKIWCDDRMLAGLVRALDDVIHLQGRLCSFGGQRSITTAFIAARAKALRRHHAAPTGIAP